MKLSPDSAPIFNETRIARIAALAFKSYIKLWGKQHFQIIIIETDNPMRLIFNALLAKELAKVSGIKIDQNLSLEMTGKPLEHTNVPGKPKLYTVLTNAAGGKIKESINEGKDIRIPCKHCGMSPGEHQYKTNKCLQDIGTKNERHWPEPNRYHTYEPSYEDSIDESQVDEDTESSAFMGAAPENCQGLVTSPNSPHGKKIPFGGQTGNDINADARRHLKQMSGNLGSQLEATNI
jgi:hypothetical protein